MSEERKTKAIRSGRVCYNCALPITEPGLTVCPRCHGTDIDDRRSRPTNYGPRGYIELPHPMTNLRMKKGGTMLLSGGPGSGKTTICLAARPKIISSSEQENEEVAAIWYRVHKDDPCPIVSSCLTWEELEDDLLQLSEGELGVVDSISQLASGPESSKILSRAIRAIRAKGALAIFITQYTKEGEMLGPNELRHMVDVVASIPDDPSGLRRLAVQKNRFGPIFAQYFSIGEHGIKDQNFPWAYSVEGPPGRYSLHLFPMSGGKWTGIFDAFAKAGVKVYGGVASAALLSPVYETGFVEPDDVEWRMKFASDHGLEWISPDKAVAILIEKASQREEE